MKVKKTKLTPSPHPSKAGPIVGDEIKRKSLNLGIAKKWRMGGVAWAVVVVVVVVAAAVAVIAAAAAATEARAAAAAAATAAATSAVNNGASA